MTEYYSLLDDKIEATRADPNQSRQVIYDLARYALKNQLFTRDPSLTAGQIHDQLILLEMAIALVEANAETRDAIRNKRRGLNSARYPPPPTKANASPPAPLVKENAAPPPPPIKENVSPPAPPTKENVLPPAPPTEANVSPPAPPTEENVSPPADDSNFEVIHPSSRATDRRRDLVVLPARNLTRVKPYANDEFADGYYQVPATREPSITPETVALIQLLASERKSTSRQVLSWLDGLFRLAVVAAFGFGIYVFWSGGIAEFAGLVTPPPRDTATAEAVVAPATPVTPAILEPSVPRPTVFGVYAIHNDRLIRLEQVPTTPVDPRTRNLQQITAPSRTMFPDGRIAFTVYRRDLVTSAPVTVPIRFAARIASVLRFGPAGTLVMIRPEVETWLIYNAGYEFQVLPVSDNLEMILIRPNDPDLVLPAGRYALMLNDQPYDFAVAGNVTDPRSCVEGAATPRGLVFYECKTAENR